MLTLSNWFIKTIYEYAIEIYAMWFYIVYLYRFFMPAAGLTLHSNAAHKAKVSKTIVVRKTRFIPSL
ncbi:MAG: hypothetical protein EOO07_27540 [Chitinophagaceae bacterium]|nr:MAG: hypothetical protein EOO07_27540 [Chitinophagaceae bacterium]